MSTTPEQEFTDVALLVSEAVGDSFSKALGRNVAYVLVAYDPEVSGTQIILANVGNSTVKEMLTDSLSRMGDRPSVNGMH